MTSAGTASGNPQETGRRIGGLGLQTVRQREELNGRQVAVPLRSRHAPERGFANVLPVRVTECCLARRGCLGAVRIGPNYRTGGARLFLAATMIAAGGAGFAIGFAFWWFVLGDRNWIEASLWGLAVGGFSAACGWSAERAFDAAAALRAAEHQADESPRSAR